MQFGDQNTEPDRRAQAINIPAKPLPPPHWHDEQGLEIPYFLR
jgi:hypothetical protein